MFHQLVVISDFDVNKEPCQARVAIGWIICEIGKRDQNTLESFLQKHYKTMPRTMLRYSIEKLDKQKKQYYMKK